jgi:hypothetical protein
VLPAELETAFDWGRHGLTVIQRGFVAPELIYGEGGDEKADANHLASDLGHPTTPTTRRMSVESYRRSSRRALLREPGNGPPLCEPRVQQILTSRRTRTGPRERFRTRYVYALGGQIVCDACGRKMQASRTNGYVYYRCRFAAEYALANKISHPRNILVREAQLVPALDEWLARQFEPDRVEVTIDVLTAAQNDPAEEQHILVQARHVIRDCEDD